jgi:predicted XRE-type DNA-binding protein
MKDRLVDGVEVQRGSGNVFADLDLPDAVRLKTKTGLVVEIRKVMRSLGLTELEAAKRMGLTQAKVADLMRGDFSDMPECDLMGWLARLSA